MSRKDRDAYNAYMRVYMKERYQAFKAEILSRLGGACKECGSIIGLEMHHVEPSKKKFTISTAWSQRAEILDVEIAKCILLCGDCHKVVHGAKHGGERLYRSGCRCGPCIEGYQDRLPAKLATKTRWRERRRQNLHPSLSGESHRLSSG